MKASESDLNEDLEWKRKSAASGGGDIRDSGGQKSIGPSLPAVLSSPVSIGPVHLKNANTPPTMQQANHTTTNHSPFTSLAFRGKPTATFAQGFCASHSNFRAISAMLETFMGSQVATYQINTQGYAA